MHTPLGAMPHATVLATALANLRDGTWMGSVSWQRVAAISAGMVLVIWALMEFVAIWLAIGLSAALVGAHIALAERLFGHGVVVPVVAPLLSSGLAFLAVTLVLVAASVRERLRIKSLFARYVSPDVVRALLESDDTIKLGGVEREITVLFSDIRGFTSLSESIDPAEMVAQLNEYFAEMVAVVTSHSGTLDKFLGDGLMAIFGAPIDQEDHAALACAAAVEMLERLKPVNPAASRGDTASARDRYWHSHGSRGGRQCWQPVVSR